MKFLKQDWSPTHIKEYKSWSKWRCRNVTPLELCFLLARDFFFLFLCRQMLYQNEDALLVSLDSDILLLLVRAGQCLVYRGHCCARVLMVLFALLTG